MVLGMAVDAYVFDHTVMAMVKAVYVYNQVVMVQWLLVFKFMIMEFSSLYYSYRYGYRSGYTIIGIIVLIGFLVIPNS